MKNMNQNIGPFEQIIIRSFALSMAVIMVFSLVLSPQVVGAKSFLDYLSVSYTDLVDSAPRLQLADGERQPRETLMVVATAYSSTPDQTDDSPFISANGTYVYDGMIAANFLPFGTLVRFPDLYGDKVFRVDDRMNARYGHARLDIWMNTRQAAKNFGVKRLKMEILGRQHLLAWK